MLVVDKAREDAEAVRYQLDLGVPVNPYDVAEHLGLDVHTGPLDDGISGMLISHGTGAPAIYLSEAETDARRRFTCAHEIGHFVERSSRITDGSDFAFIDRRDGKRDAFELYADEFAGALLMPADDVRKEWEQGRRAPAVLAARYRVSVPAMRIRLSRLGLLRAR